MNTARLIATALCGASLTTFCYLLANPPETHTEVRTPPVEEVHATIAVDEEPAAEAVPAGPIWRKHTIQPGETLGTILPRYGAPTHPVRQAALHLHDLSKLRLGRELSFLVGPDSDVPQEIHYPLDDERTLIVTHDATADTWSARIDAMTYEKTVGYRELDVTSSLWSAAVHAGLRPRDIAALAKVLEYDLDFNTEIRAGAHARMIVEELWHEGSFAKLGAPLALVFTNAGKEYVAVRFTNDKGETHYYDRDGVSRRSAFLRSPLEFSRVTSGFNMARFHPVLKTKRPHYGTDFGAPTGTPIRAVADAVVTRAGRSGGHGNFVKLDHTGPYESSYSHLSKIAVSQGQQVKQGQIIGYVGSTGLATGPHLHYQFWVNGRYVDPMTIDLPRGQMLSDTERARFLSVRDEMLAALDNPPAPTTAPEATDPSLPAETEPALTAPDPVADAIEAE